MKNTSLLFIVCFSLCSMASQARSSVFDSFIEKVIHANAIENSEKLYEELNLADYGLDKTALDYALQGYENLLTKGIINNTQYLTIVDFSQPSHNKRFYVLDIQNEELTVNTYVAHGKNSGNEIASQFSNKISSHQSSLGFYLTKHTYNGSRGHSLRLSGLEEGFNSNVEKRGVVIHGSQFVNEERALNGTMGRSQGCPALPQAEFARVIRLIKEGSVMFVYHPSEHYLSNSPVLQSYTNPILQQPIF